MEYRDQPEREAGSDAGERGALDWRAAGAGAGAAETAKTKLERACAAMRATKLEEGAVAAMAERARAALEAAAVLAAGSGGARGEAGDGAVAAAVGASRGAAGGVGASGRLFRGCEDIRAALPAYARGALAPAAAALLSDHLRGCVACRRAAAGESATAGDPVWSGAASGMRGGGAAEGREDGAAWEGGNRAQNSGWNRGWRVAALAAAAVVLAAAGWGWYGWAPIGGEARVVAASGPIYALQPGGGTAALPAAEVAYGQRARTGAATDAVLELRDGTRLELRGGSEFEITATRAGATLHLALGAVIARAAQQGPGRHLYVAARGARVAVKGTIFAVSAGLRGARVAVLRGEVRVDNSGRRVLLGPGEQFATNPDVSAAPLSEAFAWSRDAAQYQALLASLASLRKDLSQVPPPLPRYASALLGDFPADTVAYAGLPNASGEMQQSFSILQAHLSSDPVLREWWARRNGAAGVTALERVFVPVGLDLGPEVAMGFSAADFTGATRRRRAAPGGAVGPRWGAARRAPAPLFLAAITNPQDLRFRLQKLAAGGGPGPRITLVADPLAAAGARTPAAPAAGAARAPALFVWLDEADNLAAAAPSLGPLRSLERRLRSGAGAGAGAGGSSFARTPLYRTILGEYQRGVSFVAAVDAGAILKAATRHNPQAAARLDDFGAGNLDALVIASQAQAGRTTTRAALKFSGPRAGAAAWLAAPAPLPALDYFSPQAGMVVAAQLEQPSEIVKQIVQLAAGGSPQRADQIQTWLAITGDIPQTLAAPLTGEMAAGLDGPMLPRPGWRVVLGVRDADAMQRAMQGLLAAVNGLRQARGAPPIALATTTAEGRTVYSLPLPNAPADFGFSYAYSAGYLVAGPNSATVAAALRVNAAGDTLPRSAEFQTALPRGSELNCSAVYYSHLGPSLAGLAGKFGARGNSSAGSGEEAEPSAACVVAEGDSIQVAVNAARNPFAFGFDKLLGMPGVAGWLHKRPAYIGPHGVARGRARSRPL